MRPILLLLLATAAILLAQETRPQQRADPAPTAQLHFRDVAPQAGIRFVMQNSPTERKHLIETMPGGVAAFDYNNDGRPDIYFTNGAPIPSLEKSAPEYFNRLYRNDGGLKFTDVTEDAGVQGAGYSMAAAAADYDNDGNTDLFVAGVSRHTLYRNLGNGKFRDVTAQAGIRSDQWAVAAAWFDYDNDGKLDLFVVNYTKWNASMDRFCGDVTRNIRVYCHPKWFEPIPSTLYRNRGDGTFEDVSAKSGIAAHRGRGMGIGVADYDDDGYMDVYVTNDKLPSFLFHNRGNGTFEEVGVVAGVSLPDHGQEISAMAADFRDYDNDGLPDLLVTALAGETYPLFRNTGKGMFVDASYSSRMGALSVRRSGWSNAIVDLNNDGWKDIFTADSHVNDRIEAFEASAYKLPNSVFLNTGGGKFVDASAESGLAAGPARAHRGSAFADFDGDGRIDVMVSALGGEAELWHNESTGDTHWLMLKLRGTRSNRDGIGARVRISAAGDSRWTRQFNHMTSAVGYASSSFCFIHFGTGAAKIIDELEIRWPSGRKQALNNVATDRNLEVRESED